MTNSIVSLADMGWRPHFQAQLELHELAHCRPLRVMAVHRGAVELAGPEERRRAEPPLSDTADRPPTVGDWLLCDAARIVRMLEPFSLIQRRAAGIESRMQAIAANIDTLLIVTSCNEDFKPARLERYLALALDAQVQPLVVLTKSDLTDDVAAFRRTAERLHAGLMVEPVDARDPGSAGALTAWAGPGQTLALVGSSGVGKSTLVNTLTGQAGQATAAIRQDDAKGRHTTTGRSMHRLPSGGWLLDTPGMRELRLSAAADGIDVLFEDIVELARRCRFTDCRHADEPGCAVQAAIADGRLEPERLRRAQKLWAEDRLHAESVHQRRRRERAFGKVVREAMADRRIRRGRD